MELIRIIRLLQRTNTHKHSQTSNLQMARSNKTNKAQAKEQNKENPQDVAEEVILNKPEEVVDTVKAETTGGKKEKKTKKEKKSKEETKTDDESASDKEKTDDESASDKEQEGGKKEKTKKEKKPKADKKEKEEKKPKEKKRAPSAYNLFVKEIMPKLKEEFEGSDKTQRDLMKVAAERWNEKKNEKQ